MNPFTKMFSKRPSYTPIATDAENDRPHEKSIRTSRFWVFALILLVSCLTTGYGGYYLAHINTCDTPKALQTGFKYLPCK